MKQKLTTARYSEGRKSYTNNHDASTADHYDIQRTIYLVFATVTSGQECEKISTGYVSKCESNVNASMRLSDFQRLTPVA